jgi:hypothetical protein
MITLCQVFGRGVGATPLTLTHLLRHADAVALTQDHSEETMTSQSIQQHVKRLMILLKDSIIYLGQTVKESKRVSRSSNACQNGKND